MEINRAGDKTGETATDFQNSGNSGSCGNVRSVIADTMNKVSEALDEKADRQEAQFGTDQYGRQASEWLDKSAEYVREVDYKQADADVREYFRHGRGRRLLIAGGVGLGYLALRMFQTRSAPTKQIISPCAGQVHDTAGELNKGCAGPNLIKVTLLGIVAKAAADWILNAATSTGTCCGGTEHRPKPDNVLTGNLGRDI